MPQRVRYTNSHKSNMNKVTIYELDGSFDIYDEAGHMIEEGFASHDEAVLWANENNFEIVDVFFAVLEK